MLRFSRRFLCGALALLCALTARAPAARPLLDYHRLDAYFALFAGDSSVPWKPASVRLDTYTSAPVDFAVYAADVAQVISAGANTRPRAVDTRKLHAIARWTFTPSGGYRFQSSDVQVPIGPREGFFVVEARRGNVGEQVWIDRTRIGLLTKESPAGITVYGADLGTGSPLAHMRVSFIAGGRFVDRVTGADGLVTWRNSPRPVFAMAQWGGSVAFLSFLPQAPLPKTIVAVNTESAVVHAGDDLHVIGYARTRSGARLRPSSGTATIVARSMRGAVAERSAHLDASGAFDTAIRIPQTAPAGDYVVLATVNGATSATAIHVDANANGLSLDVSPQCDGFCSYERDVPVFVRATRNGVPAAGIAIDLNVVRSPHAYAGDSPDDAWGTASWYDASAQTNGDGLATFAIPRPQDGLASTYGVRVSSGGATADTRVVVPSGDYTVRVRLDRDDIGSGAPANFDVSANVAASGKPDANGIVRVELLHGASVQQQTLQLDASGRAHGSFSTPEVGSNLILAQLDATAAEDAAQLQVEPQTMESSASSNRTVTIALDRAHYTAGSPIRVDASLSGAQGTALITFESAGETQFREVPVNDGHASAGVRASDQPGNVTIGAAFVRDGTLEWDSVPVAIDAPGRPLSTPLELDRSTYAAGTTATARITGAQEGAGTLIVRITRGRPTGSALFSTAPDLLAVGTTTTQNSAGDGSWHPWVDSSGDHPVIQSFAPRTAPPENTMMQADTASVYWSVARSAGSALDVPVPRYPGKYVISLLKVADDGRVIEASADLLVQ